MKQQRRSYNIRKVQDRLLFMGAEIIRILDKHSIPYCLSFGTLLGAIRHKGFIPWDDDFDIWLFDDTYSTALNWLAKELPNDMFLEFFDTEPLYFHSWAHVKDLSSYTECLEYPQDSCYRHKGLSIDLYKLKRIKAKDLMDYLKYENIEYLNRRKNNNLITEEEYLNRVALIDKIEETSNPVTGNPEREVFALVTANRCKFLEIDDVFPLVKTQFENYIFSVPNNSNGILTKIYNDYMKLPPEDKRVSHFSSVIFCKK